MSGFDGLGNEKFFGFLFHFLDGFVTAGGEFFHRFEVFFFGIGFVENVEFFLAEVDAAETTAAADAVF